MRKFAAIALLLALLVSGCGGEARQAAESAPPGEIVESYAGTAVTVTPMEPGEEAALLLKNVSAASGEDIRVYDYESGDAAAADLRVMEFKDGAWQPYTAASRMTLPASSGSFALVYGEITEGVGVSFFTEDGQGGGGRLLGFGLESAPRAGTSLRGALATAVTAEDGLVPVAIIVYKDGTDGVISAAPEDYNNPDAFADCDAAYAVTLTFVPQ